MVNECKMIRPNDTDYFSIIGEEPLNVAYEILVWCTIELLGNSLLIWMIWYEKYGIPYEETLLNRLVRIICWSLVFHNVITMNLVLSRWFIGPSSWITCSVISVLGPSLFCFGNLAFCEITILRYLYLAHKRDLFSMTDSFWVTFLTYFNLIMGFTYGLGLYFTDSINPRDFAICLGVKPKEFHLPALVFPQNPVPDFSLILMTLSLILAVNVKILWRYRQPPLDSRPPFSLPLCAGSSVLEKDMLTDFVSGSLFVLMYFLMSMIPTLVVHSVWDLEELLVFPLSLLFLIAYFNPHVVGSLLLPGLYILRNKNMRQITMKSFRLGALKCFLGNQYTVEERPVVNESDVLELEFGLELQQIIDVNERDQVIRSNMWLNLRWKDYALMWEPKEYGGVYDVRLPPDKIWTPDILLTNSASQVFNPTYPTNIVVSHTGECNFIPPGIFQSTCKINILWFPFDDQECIFKFVSWTYDASMLNITLKSNTAILDGYLENGEWQLLGFPAIRTVTSFDGRNYIEANFMLNLRRRTMYYFSTLILPCVLIGITLWVIEPLAG
eukprot:snap_masked-scaffold131_size323982-processed-gene-0.6 protein:Tk05542 transcript:snap_masked-scaffold131_size323982-processed-gene-0.6-mRNA-1 annotation:"truncated nicotinic acetylcholine receptor subunit a6"